MKIERSRGWSFRMRADETPAGSTIAFASMVCVEKRRPMVIRMVAEMTGFGP
jgi:hypothetical protein